MKLSKYIFLFLCYSSFGQPNWQKLDIISNSNNQRFDDIFFLNENVGWAVNGYYASVYKTINGGVTWNEQFNESSLGGNFYFRNVEFLNENIGFLGTLNNTLFKTIDGGENWIEVDNISPNPAAICGLDTVGSSTIYGCGAYFTPAYLIKSSDSGQTWTYVDMSSYANALVEIYFLDENIGFVTGRSDNGATILKTINGGTSWSEIYNSEVAGEYLWKIQVLENNPDVIFGSIQAVSPNLGKLVKSIDGGITWSTYNAPETSIQAVGFISEMIGWMGGHTTGFHETNDGGQTWNNLNIGNNLNRIFIIDNNLAYASGTSLYKYTEDLLNTNNLSDNGREKLEVILSKNPVYNNVEFNINFLDHDNLLIELYNSYGKYIKHLGLYKIDKIGINKYTFPVTHLSSGVYFIDMHNNTGRQSVKFVKK